MTESGLTCRHRRSPILAVALALLVTACGHGHGDGAAAHHEDHGEHVGSAQSTVQHDLQLNAAAKWEMDAHTRSMFEKMAGRFEGVDPGAAEPATLKESGVKLREDIDALIAGCTMTGEAHDELHKYLVLYIPAVNALATDGDRESGQRVHELLSLYTDYFE